jgi:hypothetical protein
MRLPGYYKDSQRPILPEIIILKVKKGRDGQGTILLQGIIC